MADLLITWTSADGEEHDERWPSVDAFLAWAKGEQLQGDWRSYEEDEDGDFILTAKGTI